LSLYLDLGHGAGTDRGAAGGGTTERDILEAVVNPVAAYLTALGVVAVPSIDLRERLLWVRARAVVGDELVSLHCNTGPPAARGVEVYYRADGAEWHRQRAGRLAEFSARYSRLLSRGAKPDDTSQHHRLAVCRDAGCPGFLLELGFLTNDEDRAALLDRGSLALVATLAAWQGI